MTSRVLKAARRRIISEPKSEESEDHFDNRSCSTLKGNFAQAALSFVGSATRSIARSFTLSVSTTFAVALSFQVGKATLMLPASAITCQLVAMRPPRLKRKPAPETPTFADLAGSLLAPRNSRPRFRLRRHDAQPIVVFGVGPDSFH